MFWAVGADEALWGGVRICMYYWIQAPIRYPGANLYGWILQLDRS
jgi:hypothetical protein